MVRVRKRIGIVSGARIPAWVGDKSNQSKWNDRFKGILKRDYENSDIVIAAILGDEGFFQRCATKIRSYVDKNATAYLNAQSKARGAKYKKKLETAIVGCDATIDLYANLGKQEFLSVLRTIKKDLSQVLGKCKRAFATKRHGRDRDHAILHECHSFLRGRLKRSVTYVTLANLVNAGFEADDNSLETDEIQVRKNLANFRRNNPLWRNEYLPHPKPPLSTRKQNSKKT